MAVGETQDSLSARFAALQAERARNWSAAQLATNAAQRSALLADFDARATISVGEPIGDAPLIDSSGRPLRLADLLGDGPVVLILFRYATCPADNIALPYYDRVLRDAGVRVVAISPQLPDRLDEIRVRHGLSLTVASDPDNRLAGRLGLTFTPIETPSPPPPGWIGDVTGTGTWELPLTSLLILDQDGIVRFAAISPDWLDRVEGDVVSAAIARLRQPALVEEGP